MKIPIKRSYFTRALAFLIGDVVLLAAAVYVAFALRFDWHIPQNYTILTYAVIFILIKVPIFALFRLYSMTWSFAGAYEVMDVLKAAIVAQIGIELLVYVVNPLGIFVAFPRSVVLLDFLIATAFIGVFRLSKRLYLHLFLRAPTRSGKATLIVGAGSAGEMIVRDIHRHEMRKYYPMAYVDDDAGKKGMYIRSVKVAGKIEDIPDVVAGLGIQAIIVAIPSASSKEMRRITGFVKESGIKDVRVLPGIQRILDGSVTLGDLKVISIEDIVGREQVTVDVPVVERFVRGKAVLVTGAGGSIGSEIVRQVIRFGATTVFALDIDETDIFNLEAEIRQTYTEDIFVPVIADVGNEEKVRRVMKICRPDVVLHAAAYKHVPMMELFPEEALRVNVFGTLNLLNASLGAGVEKFVMISTDKAVTPTSIMGTTKRLAEELVKLYNTKNSTQFMAVRFGNVVGSRGSVIPIFRDQIARGGPVTVTHKDMTRYFMSIPEAVGLVLQAASMGQGGEVFILDMGEPVKILDVAEEMIRLHGLEPDKDIPILFTGIRKGEKLTESLTTPVEFLEPTSHPKISKSNNEIIKHDILEQVDRLRTLMANPTKADIVAVLKDIIPAYTPDLSE